MKLGCDGSCRVEVTVITLREDPGGLLRTYVNEVDLHWTCHDIGPAHPCAHGA